MFMQMLRSLPQKLREDTGTLVSFKLQLLPSTLAAELVVSRVAMNQQAGR